MILQTGSRTDIPAFYSEWFWNRLREGFADVRSPFDPIHVTRYRLDPKVVDALCFCSKNPAPLFPKIHLLDPFRVVFQVTITPYGRDIEPNVPDAKEVMETFRKLSSYTGRQAILWRYDPVLIHGRYTVEFHKKAFHEMAGQLSEFTEQAVVSFVDLYQKTRRSFPGIRMVTKEEQEELAGSFGETAGEYGMTVHLCHESAALVRPHVDADGCFTKEIIEHAIGEHLKVPKMTPARAGCSCLLGADIGAYNTCPHGCLYCYANADRESVIANRKKHDPESTMLVGHLDPGDRLHLADQKSWIDPQMTILDWMKEKT